MDLAIPTGAARLGSERAEDHRGRILSTLLAFDAGRAEVAGSTCCATRSRFGTGLALTGQYAAVDEILSGGEPGDVPPPVQVSTSAARRRADELLDQFGLGEAATARLDSTPAACAGGSTWPPA